MIKRKLPLDCDDDIDEEIEEKTAKIETFDEFLHYLNHIVTPKEVESIKNKDRKGSKFSLPGLDQILYSGGSTLPLRPLEEVSSMESLQWTEKLIINMKGLIKKEYKKMKTPEFDSILSLMARYVDMSMLIDKKKNKMHKIAYCSHLLNHVIRTRNYVLGNKHKLEKISQNGAVDEDVIESLRDQGFVRPTVVILAPYRKDVLQIVEIMKWLMFGVDGKADVLNKSRFEEEYGQGDTKVYSKLKEDDEDDGNRDDCFRLGVGLSRKSLKLYTPFDVSDILICSPLGLRMVIGGDGGQESHILSSIQLVVIDDADILLQQNWEHVPLILNTMHSQPNKINTDVSRVRTVYLDGFASNYCQTLLFSSHRHELFSALSLSRFNHRGLITFKPPSDGILTNIELRICQELHVIRCSDASTQSDTRFAFFKEKIWPTLTGHTAVFIPSYFDYVRLRNLFKKETESFVQCHEYAPPKKITRARDLFFHGEKKLMLITERFHHFNRFNLRGIKRLVFYQPPSRPSFYIDIINMCQPDNRLLSTLLFTKFDRIRMENIFGLTMGTAILKSDKDVQAIVSE